MGGGDVWGRVYTEAATAATTSGEPGDVRIVGVRPAGGNRQPCWPIPKFNIHIAAGRTGFPRNAAQITIRAMMMDALIAVQEIRELTQTRARTHGDYETRAIVSQRLKMALGKMHNLPAGQREALEMICVKMSRIVCGDPATSDHWDDIAGYAVLGKPRP